MKFAPLVLLIALGVPAAFGACPVEAPGAMGIVTTPLCYPTDGCPNGTISFEVVPAPSGGFPPAPYNPGYSVQPCDTVTWDFGDGSTQTIAGDPAVAHAYPNPGNYVIRATVTNAYGTATVEASRMIATSPSRLSFVTRSARINRGTAREFSCGNCVVAGEETGQVTIEVERSLDLSRTVSAVAHISGKHVAEAVAEVAVPLTFAPGETRKAFTVPIANDNGFYGPRWYLLIFSEATGGTLTQPNTSSHPSLVITDDDPIPTLFLGVTQIVMYEGDAGKQAFSIPVYLTAPMLVDATANVFHRADTATWDDFESGFGVRVPAGATSATLIGGWIRGDARPERDESFVVEIAPRSTSNDPLFGARTVVVTILNDDAELYPQDLVVNAGTTTRLMLDVGSAYSLPTTITFSSTNEKIVPAPAPVVIPAGASQVEVFVTARSAGTAAISASARDRKTRPATITVNPAKDTRRRSARH